MHIQILDNASTRNVVRSLPMVDAAPYIDAVTYRAGLGAYIMGQCRTRGSAYVAANRSSPWHVAYGSRGFIVEVVA